MSAGFRQVWVVQDRQSGDFLYPSPDGDVGFTMYLSDAGRFDCFESAVDTAQFHLDDDYRIASFYEKG